MRSAAEDVRPAGGEAAAQGRESQQRRSSQPTGDSVQGAAVALRHTEGEQAGEGGALTAVGIHH